MFTEKVHPLELSAETFFCDNLKILWQYSILQGGLKTDVS